LEAARYLTVNATVNNEPVRLLVDTGDGVSVLDQSLAKRLKLSSIKWEDPARGSLLRQDVSGNLIGFGGIGSHKAWVATLNSLQIGMKSWTNVSYGVVNLSDWGLSKAGGAGSNVQGFFGNDLLHGQGAVIDFCNLKLWFRPEKEHH
jgi:hypothetical protein